MATLPDPDTATVLPKRATKRECEVTCQGVPASAPRPRMASTDMMPLEVPPVTEREDVEVQPSKSSQPMK